MEATPYDLTPTDGYEYRTRYWRCRKCGQERTHRDEFAEACETPAPPTTLEAGGYSIDDPRTRREMTEDMDVHFGSQGPRYEVHSESGATYEVNVDEETCTCPNFEQRHPDGGCKYLRRVDLEIRARQVPASDGTFVR